MLAHFHTPSIQLKTLKLHISGKFSGDFKDRMIQGSLSHVQVEESENNFTKKKTKLPQTEPKYHFTVCCFQLKLYF